MTPPPAGPAPKGKGKAKAVTHSGPLEANPLGEGEVGMGTGQLGSKSQACAQPGAGVNPGSKESTGGHAGSSDSEGQEAVGSSQKQQGQLGRKPWQIFC